MTKKNKKAVVLAGTAPVDIPKAGGNAGRDRAYTATSGSSKNRFKTKHGPMGAFSLETNQVNPYLRYKTMGFEGLIHTGSSRSPSAHRAQDPEASSVGAEAESSSTSVDSNESEIKKAKKKSPEDQELSRLEDEAERAEDERTILKKFVVDDEPDESQFELEDHDDHGFEV